METNARGSKNVLTLPAKPQAPLKKQRAEEDTTAGAQDGNASNNAIRATIGNLQNMMEHISQELKQNTLTISDIAKVDEFNSSESVRTKKKELRVDIKTNEEEEHRPGEESHRAGKKTS